MNKEVVISEQDLVKYVRQLLEQSALPSFKVAGNTTLERFDLFVTTTTDDNTYDFAVDCKLRPTVRDIDTLHRFDHPRPLLATVKLTPSLVEECKRQKVSCLDLNGRVWISAKGLMIDRDVTPRTTRYVLEEPPVNFFSLKSSRVARVLLSFQDRTWKQADIANLTQLSKGLVSRLLKYATQQGWVEDARGAWRIIKPDSLLTAWEEADEFRKRVAIRQYSIIETDFRVLAQRLLQGLPGDLAFTQWFAASLRFPYTTTPVLSVYRRQFPSNEELSRLDLREVADGGKIWILAPRDAGVFQTVRRVKEFPLVCDAQIYLDLLQVGLRGPDQAKALREWKGFCKP